MKWEVAVTNVNTRLRVRTGPGTSYRIVNWQYPDGGGIVVESRTVNGETWYRWEGTEYWSCGITSSGTIYLKMVKDLEEKPPQPQEQPAPATKVEETLPNSMKVNIGSSNVGITVSNTGSVTGNLSKGMVKLLTRIFDLDKKHVFITDNPIDYRILQDVTSEKSENSYKKFTPQYPSELIGEHDMFSAIDSNDILLHHPYESYDPVIKFLEHAANDEDTISIKQTLYRVPSIDSPIINALCRAAENGKQVSIILELKARFDEERNISLIHKLKMSGCNF